VRFLILTQYFPPEVGAPQVRLAAMVRELKGQGHEVEVVTALPNHPRGEIFPEYRGRFYVREDWEGVPVHRLWLYPATGAGLKRLLNYASFAFTSLFGLFRARRPDYLFVESPPLFLSVPAYLWGLPQGVPFIFNVADLWPDSVRELGLMREGWVLRLAEGLEAWTYRKARFVNAVTEGIRRALIEEKGVPEEKVLFLPNGVDTALFRPREPDEALVRELGLLGKKVVVYAGTLGVAQGLEVALAAMRALEHERPELHLLLLGGGSEEARLKALAREWGLSNVTFADPVPLHEVPRYLSLAYAGLVMLKDVPLFEGARPSKTFPIMGASR